MNPTILQTYNLELSPAFIASRAEDIAAKNCYEIIINFSIRFANDGISHWTEGPFICECQIES
jgi:hypothetical protein